MESSDDSFAWTNASSDSLCSDKAMSSGGDKHDEGSESGYDYKKKLHKRILNGLPETKKKKKAKKRKHEDFTSESSDYQPTSKKRIKSESEETAANVLEAESYLNLRVKEEQNSFREPIDSKPKKKKKHKRSVNEEDSFTIDSINNETELSTMNDTLIEKDIEINRESETSFAKKKKKKSKRHDVTVSEDEEMSNCSVVKEKSKRKSKSPEDINNLNENSVIANDCNGRSFVSSTLLDNTINETQIDDEANIIQKSRTKNKTKSIVSSNNLSDRVSKISDRLTFEDDNILNFEYAKRNDTDKNKLSLSNNNNIKCFKNVNTHLSQSKIVYNLVESNDEEVWVLKCPFDMNINDFKDLDLLIDGKSKTKIGGQHYERTKDESITRLTQITYCDNKPTIENVPVKGYFRFCKRIPKPHIPDDSTMINNQTNFIPLPDTKCRHPLFGEKYKKFTKVPKSLQQRLNEDNSMSVPKTKKKKHKKEKTKIEIDSELEAKHTTEFEDRSSSKKKRKRKSSCKEEYSPTLSKKIKLELNSPPTWESEKAIEENLFNF